METTGRGRAVRQTGRKGPQGPTGPRGLCEAYATSSGLDPLGFSTGNELTVATLNLPPGAYVLDAKVLVGNRSSSSNEDFTCTLRYGAPGFARLIDIAETRLFGGPMAAGSHATLPLAGSISLSSSDTIALICATTSNDAFAQYAKLNAIKVEKLTTQP